MPFEVTDEVIVLVGMAVVAAWVLTTWMRI